MINNYGEIRFDSEPENIDVYLNEEHIGVTPLDVVDVIPGIYSYSMKKDEEHQFSSELQVKQRKITHIIADFTKNSINKEYNDITDRESPFPETVSRSEPDSPKIRTESSANKQPITTESSANKQPITTESSANKQPITTESSSEEQPILTEEQPILTEEEQSLTEEKSKQANIPKKLITSDPPIRTKDNPRKTKEKSIFYNTGHVSISVASTSPPDSSDDYPSIQDIYVNNSQNPIEIMTLMNHGPGDIFYILRDKSQTFSTTEEALHVGESRILYNVYEIRLRTDIPDTVYHLIEGEIRAGSFSRNYKNFIENRLVLQPNEFDCTFELLFDTNFVVVPGTALPTNNALFIRANPLAAGTSAVLINTGNIPFDKKSTTSPFPAPPAAMPFLIPTGYIAEAFSMEGSMNTNYTVRNYLELVPSSGIYTLLQTWPFPSRAEGLIRHNLNVTSTGNLDFFGAPAPGRNFILTITNDDNANSMTGHIAFEVTLRKLS